MKKQFWLAFFILMIAIIFLRFHKNTDAVPLLADIEGFPKKVGSFTMAESSEFSEDVLRELQVSSYINRIYREENGYQLSLYVGYYDVQKEGTMIHSPKHCMPGSGWFPLEATVVPIGYSSNNEYYKVNRILFQKGIEKIIMYYWYQGRNRIVANEYIDKLFLVVDSVLRQRSDGALVRVIGPWDSAGNFEKKQEQFVASLFPILQQHLPH
jgi:EpsI family protein